MEVHNKNGLCYLTFYILIELFLLFQNLLILWLLLKSPTLIASECWHWKY